MRTVKVSEEGQIIHTREVGGLSLIEALFPPKLSVSQHRHEVANFGFVLHGECTELYGRKTREYGRLSWDYLPEDHEHSVRYADAATLTFGIHIGASVRNSLADGSLPLRESLHGHGGQVAWHFSRLYCEFRRDDTASSLAIKGICLEMLAEAARQKESNRKISSRRPAWVGRVQELLHAKFLEPLSLDSIAESVGVHSVHLCREFRRHFNTTVWDYVRDLRIRHASQLMLDSEATLAEIAQATGFSDQSHFSRTFKRFVGMSPAAFRKSLRQPLIKIATAQLKER